MEVKGVTLEIDGIALFPDAPTERGARHMKELAAARKEGYRAAVIFLVQMGGIKTFSPNKLMDSGFSEALADCLLYTSPSPRDRTRSRMPSSA